MNSHIKSLLIGALAASELTQALTLTRRGGDRNGRDGDRDRRDRDDEADEVVRSLPSLCVNPDTVTMSGFSAGGQFAHTMQMAHASSIRGVGIMNGGAYTSTADQYTDAAVSALDLTAAAVAAASQYDIDGTVDDLRTNLGNDFAYIVGGTLDEIVPLKNQEAIVETYANWGATTINDTVEDGTHCIQEGKPAEIIQWLYTSMGVATEFEDAVDRAADFGSAYRFDQLEIATDLGLDAEANGIRDCGYVYVPDTCVEEGAEACHVHFAFHGEDGGRLKNHYNAFAAANNIIMVYPKSSAAWDVEGLIDENNFANQNGAYPQLIMSMIDTLVECPVVDPVPEPAPVDDDTVEEDIVDESEIV